MNVIMGMKELNTPLKLVGLRIFKAYDGHFYIKVGKRPRKRLFKQQTRKLAERFAN